MLTFYNSRMKILILGQGPLPAESGEKNNAPGFRAGYFALALAEAGHAVTLVSIHNKPIKPVYQQLPDGITLYSVPERAITHEEFLTNLPEQPEAVVGAGIWPSYLAALYLPATLPLWADVFGSPLAEAQAKAAVYQDDSVIEPFARYERTVLARADVFSSVSTPQQYALVGALALMGRLNAATYGYRFAYSIPAALDETPVAHSQIVFRGGIVPQEAFVVLWSGGYNTWTDVDTLFAGLEGAMAQCSEFHFVSTGGALPPHDSATYPRFCQLVEKSPFRQRYHLQGWQPFALVHNYYYEANLGIILDKWSYEGMLGSRTRLLDWAKYGLPAVTTVAAELTEELATAGAVFAFPHGDSQALTNLLVDLSNNKSKLKQAGEIGQTFVQQKYHYRVVSAPLLAWASAPCRAPDADLAKPALNDAPNFALERQVESLISQIEQKNAHITELEKWAHELDASLQQQNTSKLHQIRTSIRQRFKL